MKNDNYIEPKDIKETVAWLKTKPKFVATGDLVIQTDGRVVGFYRNALYPDNKEKGLTPMVLLYRLMADTIMDFKGTPIDVISRFMHAMTVESSYTFIYEVVRLSSGLPAKTIDNTLKLLKARGPKSVLTFHYIGVLDQYSALALGVDVPLLIIDGIDFLNMLAILKTKQEESKAALDKYLVSALL